MIMNAATESISPAVARMVADQEKEYALERETKAAAQRWPIPLKLRSYIIGIATRLCGLETTEDGKVQKITSEPPPKSRDKLAAMRVIASYDKLSIDERKADLLENPTGELPRLAPERPHVSPEVATKGMMMLADAPVLPPEPPKAPIEQAEIDLAERIIDSRWVISMELRQALVVGAAELIGAAVSDDGSIEPIAFTEENPAPKRRVMLASLRILARFDRLSIEHRRVERLYERPRRDSRPRIDPEILAAIHDLVQEDIRRQAEQAPA
jgi:hypothetical protein